MFLTTIKPKGNYALIGGAKRDNNSKFLYLGQMNVLEPLIEKGDIQLRLYNHVSILDAFEEALKNDSYIYSFLCFFSEFSEIRCRHRELRQL